MSMADAHWLGMSAGLRPTGGLPLFARTTSERPDKRPVLVLLHGFPQTHALWARVTAHLAERFWLVLPDLRGYGDSPPAPDDEAHHGYSKRAMAADVIGLLDRLGVERFYLCGHDRGGRVAHRLALDHPQRLQRLCLIDIAPTLDMYARTDMDFARAYDHWFHLIQPAPLPEKMIGGCATDYLHAKLGGWGGDGLAHIEPAALADYERCFTPAHIHAMCEDYRASAGIDLEHDRASREAGQRIACDTLLIWGRHGVVHRFFEAPALWQGQCSAQVETLLLDAGHYVPEQCPDAVAAALLGFMAGQTVGSPKTTRLLRGK
jgi:haloacetate dehalogenase